MPRRTSSSAKHGPQRAARRTGTEGKGEFQIGGYSPALRTRIANSSLLSAKESVLRPPEVGRLLFFVTHGGLTVRKVLSRALSPEKNSSASFFTTSHCSGLVSCASSGNGGSMPDRRLVLHPRAPASDA